MDTCDPEVQFAALEMATHNRHDEAFHGPSMKNNLFLVPYLATFPAAVFTSKTSSPSLKTVYPTAPACVSSLPIHIAKVHHFVSLSHT